MKKKETFNQKRKRVYKKLINTLKIQGKIKDINNDDRQILLAYEWANSDYKTFNFPSSTNKNPWDETISAEEFAAGFQDALTRAIKYAKDKKLMDASYGIGDNYNNSVQVVGYRPISDQKLIDLYVSRKKEQEKRQLAEKKKTAKNIKSKEEAIREIARLVKRFSI